MEYRDMTKIVRNMNLYKNSINKKKYDLNDSEFELVRYVSKRERRSMSEVIEYLNVDKGLVTRMCKKLEEKGYIKIEKDENDSRRKILIPLQKSFEIKNDVYNEELAFYTACFKVLDSKEEELFLSLLDKVYLESKRLRKTSFQDLKDEK